MNNPFEILDARLSNIEILLLDLKHFQQTEVAAVEAEQLLTIEQLGKLLCLSKSTIHNMKSKGMPHLKIGDSLRFQSKAVLLWLQKYKQG